MKYKLLILDLDGTVIPPRLDGMPNDKVRDTILRAKEFIQITVATGRPYYLAKNILESLQISGPCVLDGGAQIMDIASKEILFERFLSIETQKEIFDLCLSYGYQIYTSNKADDVLRSIDEIQSKTGKLVISGVTPEDTISIVEDLEAVKEVAVHPVNLSWVRPDLIDIHITNIEGTKKTAIEELLKIYKMPQEEVIGIGDNHNDMPLFASVGFKIAMGQAPDELKSKADYVAPALDDDGVAEAIERFVINK